MNIRSQQQHLRRRRRIGRRHNVKQSPSSPFILGAFFLILLPGLGLGQTLSVPVRWCAIEGSPAADTPEIFLDPFVEEPTTDHTLWRRHERVTDQIYLPQADVTFRSAVWNVVEATDLNFPIIEDPCDPSEDALCPGVTGDVLIPSENADEWNDVYNECVARWDEDLEAGNIGIVIVNVRKIVDSAGDRAIGGWTTTAVVAGSMETSPLSIMVEDFAFRTPNATDPDVAGMNSWRDDVDYLVGHELGHRLTIGHVCDQDNMMNWQGIDRTVALANFELITDAEELIPGGSTDCSNSSMEVDQISDLRDAAVAVPGCKENGTNTDCSVLSDVKADDLRDVPNVSLDISLATISQFDGGHTAFSHQLFGQIHDDGLGVFDTLDYFFLVDSDGDATTGGSPAELDIPTVFEGAELVTRVRITGSATFAVPQTTVWRFEDDSFVEIADPSIEARVHPRVGQGLEPTPNAPPNNLSVATSDVVYIDFSDEVRGPLSTPFRVQAITRGTTADGALIVTDRLDSSEEEEGRSYVLLAPTFPVCSVAPEAVEAGAAATVQVEGLLPGTGAHVVFGSTTVAAGVTDAAGEATVAFLVPADAREGAHLVTVGSDGTALTADCTVVVEDENGDGGGGKPGGGLPGDDCCRRLSLQLWIITLLLLLGLVLSIWRLRRDG